MQQGSTSDDFFKDLACEVDLYELYRPLDSCYFNNVMPYVPIILEIMNDSIRKAYEGNRYLLQVYDHEGYKVYEKALQFKHLSYSKDMLYFSSHSHFYAIKLASSLFVEEHQTVNLTDLEEGSFNLDLNLVGMYQPGSNENMILLFETDEFQIDFNELQISSISDRAINYTLVQKAHIQPRAKKFLEQKNDPIVKTLIINSQRVEALYEKTQVLALRSSGEVDLYQDFKRVSSYSDKIADIDASFTTYYFKLVDGSMKQLKLNSNDLSLMKDYQDESYQDHTDIMCDRVQPYVHLYTGSSFCSDVWTSIYISHNKFISFYDTIKGEWTRHTIFPSDIIWYPELNYVYTACGKTFSLSGYQNLDEATNHTQIPNIDGQRIVRIKKADSYLFLLLKKRDGTLSLTCYYGSTLYTIKEAEYETERFNAVSSPHGVMIQTQYKLCSVNITTNTEQNSEGVNQNIMTLAPSNDFSTHAGSITGIIFQIVSNNSGQHLFFFDNRNIYLLIKSENKLYTFKNQHVIGIKNFSYTYFYGITQESFDVEPGIKLYNLDEIIKNKVCKGIHLKTLDIGFQKKIFGDEYFKCSVFESFKKVQISPIFHYATIRVTGMYSYMEYLTYKETQGKLMALHKTDFIYTFDVHRMRLLEMNQLTESFKDYDLSQSWKRDQVLLKSKATFPEFDDQLFDQFKITETMKNQRLKINVKSGDIKKWKVIEVINEKEVKTHITFVHRSIFNQTLFYNNRRDLFIENINDNWKVYLYKPEKLNDELFRLQKIRRIDNFNQFSSNNMLYHYSPDFAYNIIVNKGKGTFVIRDTITNQHLYEIPEEILKVEDNNRAINSFQWGENQVVRIMNKNGVEEIIDLANNYQELGCNQHVAYTDSYVGTHYYQIMPTNSWGDLVQTFKCKSDQYKAEYNMNYGNQDFEAINKKLCNISIDQFAYKICSFSYLNWSLVEQVKKRVITIEDIQEKQFLEMLYCVFPRGNSIFHILYKQDDVIMKILEMCHPMVNNELTIKHPIFIYDNYDGKSIFSLCIESNNFKLFDYLLRYLKLYPIDHHSKSLKPFIPELIRRDFPFLNEYLESRMLQNKQVAEITSGCLKEKTKGIIDCELNFIKDRDFDDKLFDKEGQESKIKCEYLDLPGIYHVNDPHFQPFFDALASTNNFDIFQNKLLQSMILFNYDVVKWSIIWRLFIPFIVFQIIFVVYTNFIYQLKYTDLDNGQTYNFIFLVVLTLFSIYFLMNEVKQISNNGFSYFLSVWNYIDFTPPIGIITIIMMNLFEEKVSLDQDVARTVISIITFFMWFKVLFFLRIFRQTGYLIRMIIMVIYDMRHFMLVLSITIIAIGDSFVAISLANNVYGGGDEDKQFVKNLPDGILFTYRMILGDWEADKFGEVSLPYVNLLFVICTVFNMIVMLNLLIAIISETFARVTANHINAAYQEMAALIAENNYLVSDSVRKSYARENQYLLVATNLEIEEEVDPDTLLRNIVTQRISELKDNIEQKHKETLEKIEKGLQQQETKFNTSIQEVKQLIEEKLKPPPQENN